MQYNKRGLTALKLDTRKWNKVEILSLKVFRVLAMVIVTSSLILSCATTLPQNIEWKGIPVHFEKVDGVIIKHASVKTSNDGNIIISGTIEATKPRIVGGGHIDLVTLNNDAETILSSGKHIPSRRGIISKRPRTFKIDGRPLLHQKGQFILRFHRGSPLQHTNQNG
jgi:hypothetical protein